MNVHKCLAGCGKTITWRFAICTDCEKIYGSSPYQWPAWLRFLWRSIQAERRQTARIKAHEVQVDMEDLKELEINQLFTEEWEDE